MIFVSPVTSRMEDIGIAFQVTLSLAAVPTFFEFSQFMTVHSYAGYSISGILNLV